MNTFYQLREKVTNTSGLLNYTISKCEISASENNFKEFNNAIDNAEMLINDLRRHIGELHFLNKLHRITVGSVVVKSTISNNWYLMRKPKIVETDFAIGQEIIDVLKAKYKFSFIDGGNHF
jgi:hypothetical protein